METKFTKEKLNKQIRHLILEAAKLENEAFLLKWDGKKFFEIFRLSVNWTKFIIFTGLINILFIVLGGFNWLIFIGLPIILLIQMCLDAWTIMSEVKRLKKID